MSERTVEAHFTKVYLELGIRSRAQLAAALSALATTDNGDPSTANLRSAAPPADA